MKEHEHDFNKQRRCMECGALEPRDPKTPKLRTQDTVKKGYLNE